MINGETYAKLTPKKAENILDKLKKEALLEGEVQ